MDLIPDTFHFLRPFWLGAIVPAIILIALAFRREKTGNSWRTLVDAHLLRHLVVDEGHGRHRWPLYMAALAWLASAVALAGPTWEKISIPGEIGRSPTVIALDMSESMDQTDLSPSRLARARYEIFDILAANADQQNGLIVYAEEPFVAVPLTEDIQVIEEMVPLLATDLMPGTGSRPDRAIQEAVELLAQADSGTGHIILLSDRAEAVAADLRAADRARDKGYRVSAIGFGNDDTGLKEIVNAGGGSFAQTRADSLDIDMVLIDPVTYGFGEQDAQLTLEVWNDAGIWLVFLPLLLAPLAFRRGWLLGLLLTISLSTPGRVDASLWDDLWASRNEQGAIAFEEDRKSEAAELFEDSDWRAASLYGAGDYEAAAESYAELEGTDSIYNRANALARQGDLQTALATYEDVLSSQPDHQDATFNRDLVKSLLEEQENSQDPQDGEPEDGEDSDPSESSEEQGDPQEGGDEQGKPSDDSSPNPESDDASASDSQDESDKDVEEAARDEEDLGEEVDKALAEAEPEPEQPGSLRDQQMARMNEEITEEAQAREQKLRQIPQDPAGLLRAKISRRYAERRYATEGY
jgi:Ca-activated chloride channel family protein